MDGANDHSRTFKRDRISVTDYFKGDSKKESEAGGEISKESPLQNPLPTLTNLPTADKQVSTSCPSTECIVKTEPSIHSDDSKITKDRNTSSICKARSQNETMNCTECGKK